MSSTQSVAKCLRKASTKECAFAQSKPKTSKNHPENLQKSSPDPSKIDARTFLNEVQKQCRIKNQQGGATPDSFRVIFSDLEPSWPPRWTHVGGQDGAKIDKKSMRKTMKF